MTLVNRNGTMKLELAFNIKTAVHIGIAIPQSVRYRADSEIKEVGSIEFKNGPE
jgi:hypothetical protein